MNDMSVIEDAAVLFGSRVRELLAKPWRDEQYERMLRGEEFSLTETSLHMSGPSNLIAAEILNQAHDGGWSVRAGHVVRGDRAHPHVWLRHDSGMILDLSADRFTSSPVLSFHETSLTVWHYEDHGEIDADPCRDLARLWTNGISPENFHEAVDSAAMIPLPALDDMPQP